MPSAVMDFDHLMAWLADRVGIDPRLEQLGEDTPMTVLDSLQAAELWIASEELGLDLPEELFLSLRTMGDFFYYYETKVVLPG
jgi:acyl carrier protein